MIKLLIPFKNAKSIIDNLVDCERPPVCTFADPEKPPRKFERRIRTHPREKKNENNDEKADKPEHKPERKHVRHTPNTNEKHH